MFFSYAEWRAKLAPQVGIMFAIRLCTIASWLVLATAVSNTPPPSKDTATGCPNELPHSEDLRLAQFKRIHKKWPPTERYPGRIPESDTDEWKKYLAEKEAGIMAIEKHSDWRWERWLEHAQVVLLRNFTASGWKLGEMPAKIHDQVVAEFLNNHKRGYDEGTVAGYITGKRTMVSMSSKLRRAVTEELHRQIADWAGYKPTEIEPTSTYGIRVYYKNSTLETHVDRVESHILSAVYVVDRTNPETPWLMVADPDLTGTRQEVDVPPGKLFFYESAKLNHGRPSVLQGNYSAHIFVHFRPIGWQFRNMDRVYGLPPHWNAPVPKRREL